MFFCPFQFGIKYFVGESKRELLFMLKKKLIYNADH